MNNNRLFDDHIKEQFSNYAPDVPPHVWENIVAGRAKRRPAGLWFTFLNGRNIALFVALLLAGGTGLWWLFKGTSTSTNEINTAQQRSAQLIQSNKTENKSGTVNPSASNNDTNSSLATTNNATANTISGNRIISADHNDAATNNSIRDGATTHPTAASSLSFYPGGKKKDINEMLNAKNKRVTGVTGKDYITTTSPEAENDDLFASGTLMGRLLFGIDAFSVTKKQQGEPKLRLSPFNYLPGCPTFEKDAAGNKKYISIYGGPDFVIRSMTDTGNSAYLQKRKESSKVTSAYSAGITYTKVFNNSMSLRAGINYSQINEKFSFVQGHLVQVVYIIDANGDTTGSYTTSGTRYKTTHNKYRSVDVPLLVGYEMGNGRLHANVNAGVVVNIYSWQKGEVLDTSYQPVDISTGKSSSPYQFKTNAGLGVTGGVAVFYKLNDNVHLMAEPYFRYNFKQMNKENLTIKQKYNTVGLRVGLRIDLH